MRESNDEVATSPVVALVSLEMFLRDLNPPPWPARVRQDIVKSAFEQVLSGKHDFRLAVYGKGKPDAMAKPLAKSKEFAKRVHEG